MNNKVNDTFSDKKLKLLISEKTCLFAFVFDCNEI